VDAERRRARRYQPHTVDRIARRGTPSSSAPAPAIAAAGELLAELELDQAGELLELELGAGGRTGHRARYPHRATDAAPMVTSGLRVRRRQSPTRVVAIDVQALRLDLGLYQRELAELLNVSRRTVQIWEATRPEIGGTHALLLDALDRIPEDRVDQCDVRQWLEGGPTYCLWRLLSLLFGDAGVDFPAELDLGVPGPRLLLSRGA